MMVKRRFIVIFILLFVCSARFGMAEDLHSSAESALDDTLSSLRESVVLLSRENRGLGIDNERLRGELKALNGKMAASPPNELRINRQFADLDAAIQRRKNSAASVEEKMALIENERSMVTKSCQILEEKIALRSSADDGLRSSIAALEQENISLRTGKNGEPLPSGESVQRLQEDSNRLAAELAATEKSLQEVKGQWVELQGMLQASPEHLSDLSKEVESMERELAARQAELSQLGGKRAVENVSSGGAINFRTNNSDRQAQLLQEIGILKGHYRGLQADLKKVQKHQENFSRPLGSVENLDDPKLVSKYKECSDRNLILRSEMERLRRDMVDADRKKIDLEARAARN